VWFSFISAKVNGCVIWVGIRDAILIAALAPFAYYLFAILAARRFFANRTPPSSDFFPPVSLLKPIYGLDRDAYESFASFCRQEYPEFEILFCVSDESEPALPAIRKLIDDFPQRRIRLLIGSEPLGVSDKVNKLCRMACEARHDLLIVCDSDVRVDPDYLRTVVVPFRDPSVGAVTCLYRGLTDGSFAADIEALGNSTDFAPGVLAARLLSGLNFTLGATIATTKPRLAEIGGFESLANYFSDDYEVGNRIAAQGHRIELSPFPVSVVYPRETLVDAFRHQVRWNASIRCSRPWGHLGLVCTQGLAWTILAAVLAPSVAQATAFVAGYLALRAATAWQVAVWGMRDDLARRKMWMLPFRDAFAFFAWIASFFPRRVYWRGQEFYVQKRLLVPVSTRHP
jgi:ceramide glucosyltransferase